MNYYLSYHFSFQEKKGHLKNYAETYEVEMINKKSLSDSLSVSKNSIRFI